MEPAHLATLQRNNVDLSQITNQNVERILNSLVNRQNKAYSRNYKLSIYRTLRRSLDRLTISRRELTFNRKNEQISQNVELQTLKNQAMLSVVRSIWQRTNRPLLGGEQLRPGSLYTIMALTLGLTTNVRMRTGKHLPQNGDVLFGLTLFDWQQLRQQVQISIQRRNGRQLDEYVVAVDAVYFPQYDVSRRVDDCLRLLNIATTAADIQALQRPLISTTHVTVNTILKRWCLQAITDESLQQRQMLAHQSLGLRSFLNLNRELLFESIDR
jgi:hypothetical protein